MWQLATDFDCSCSAPGDCSSSVPGDDSGHAALLQVVLEVIEENVAQGSRVYEQGHVSLPTILRIATRPPNNSMTPYVTSALYS